MLKASLQLCPAPSEDRSSSGDRALPACLLCLASEATFPLLSCDSHRQRRRFPSGLYDNISFAPKSLKLKISKIHHKKRERNAARALTKSRYS
jgi:hypothetical protein